MKSSVWQSLIHISASLIILLVMLLFTLNSKLLWVHNGVPSPDLKYGGMDIGLAGVVDVNSTTPLVRIEISELIKGQDSMTTVYSPNSIKVLNISLIRSAPFPTTIINTQHGITNLTIHNMTTRVVVNIFEIASPINLRVTSFQDNLTLNRIVQERTRAFYWNLPSNPDLFTFKSIQKQYGFNYSIWSKYMVFNKTSQHYQTYSAGIMLSEPYPAFIWSSWTLQPELFVVACLTGIEVIVLMLPVLVHLIQKKFLHLD